VAASLQHQGLAWAGYQIGAEGHVDLNHGLFRRVSIWPVW
jgi:hypothetical protein